MPYPSEITDDPSVSLERVLRQRANWVFEGPVRVAETTYDKKHFGNSVLTLRWPLWYVQFVRDRAYVHLSAAGAAAPDEWMSVHDLIRVASGSGEGEMRNTLAESVENLRKVAPFLEGLLVRDLPTTRAAVAALVEEREAKFWS